MHLAHAVHDHRFGETAVKRELRAAGITDPQLCAAYLHCRTLHAHHGRTYYLATLTLPPQRRPAIHALYGFARWVDDVIDAPRTALPVEARAALLSEVGTELTAALAGGENVHPVVRAVADTARRYEIGAELFTAFLRSMRMDLSTTDYASFEDLRGYMYGSAAVIGLQVLPVLGTVVPLPRAAPHAAALGEAFQLTNFLRDVAEDLDRGRVYLPADILARYGVDRDLLLWCRAHRRGHPRVRDALAHLVALNREIYRTAAPGIAMLDPVSRPCVATAFTLYQGILDVIEASGFDVWSGRCTVPQWRRVQVAVPAFARAMLRRAVSGRRANSGVAPRMSGARSYGGN